MAKTTDEQIVDVEQQIRRLQGKKRKLLRQKSSDAKKQRDHALIVFAAHYLLRFPPEVRRFIEEGSDDEIRAYVDRLP